MLTHDFHMSKFLPKLIVHDVRETSQMMICYGSIEAGPITASNYLQMDAWFHLAQVVQKCSGLHFERWILKLLDLHCNRPT